MIRKLRYMHYILSLNLFSAPPPTHYPLTDVQPHSMTLLLLVSYKQAATHTINTYSRRGQFHLLFESVWTLGILRLEISQIELCEN